MECKYCKQGINLRGLDKSITCPWCGEVGCLNSFKGKLIECVMLKNLSLVHCTLISCTVVDCVLDKCHLFGSTTTEVVVTNSLVMVDNYFIKEKK